MKNLSLHQRHGHTITFKRFEAVVKGKVSVDKKGIHICNDRFPQGSNIAEERFGFLYSFHVTEETLEGLRIMDVDFPDDKTSEQELRFAETNIIIGLLLGGETITCYGLEKTGVFIMGKRRFVGNVRSRITNAKRHFEKEYGFNPIQAPLRPFERADGVIINCAHYSIPTETLAEIKSPKHAIAA